MNGKLVTLAGLLASSILLAGVQAKAERYLIFFNESEPQAKVETYLSKKQYQNMRGGAFLASAPEVKVQGSFKHIKAIEINTNSEQNIQALSSLPGVAFIEKEFFHPKPVPVNGFKLTQPWDLSLSYLPGPFGLGVGQKTPYGISLVKAPQAWKPGKQGHGSRVVILDTGIDKNHPSLKANFEKGRNFVGDQNSPYPEADGEGHGTHVAGTIAGVLDAEGFTGVAPMATILSGRVCGPEGCSNISVAEGINWGVEEKADVISMSLGGAFASLSERLAIEAAEKAGIVVVAASGNDGKPKIGYPASFPTVIAVGAINSKSEKAEFSNWGKELDVVAPGVGVVSSVPMGSGKESIVKVGGNELIQVTSVTFEGAPNVPQGLEGELVHAGLGKPDDFKNINVIGKMALISRGEIAFSEKAKNAITAGAKAVVIYNNAPGLIHGTLSQDGSILSVPVFMIEQNTAQAILTQLIDKGLVARAFLQTIATDYAPFDGTSMACPHVSGVVALMKAANKKVTPAQVRQVLSETSTPLSSENSQNQWGKGLVNAEKAVEQAAKY